MKKLSALVFAVATAIAMPSLAESEDGPYVCATRNDVLVRSFATLQPVQTINKGDCLYVVHDVQHSNPQYMAVLNSDSKVVVVSKKFVKFSASNIPAYVPSVPINGIATLPRNYYETLAISACLHLRTGIDPSMTATYTKRKMEDYNDFGSLGLTDEYMTEISRLIVRQQMGCVGN